MYEGMLQIF